MMNLTNPKISVVMAVGDVDLKYLNLSILSILNQNFSNFEFIIILDTNNLFIVDLVKKYKKKDNRIKLIFNSTKMGLARSLNIGIKKSISKYIARHDADDISSYDRLYKQLSYLENNNNISVLGSYAYKINKDGKTIGKINKKIKNKKLLYYENLLIHPSTMFVKKIFYEVGQYNENLMVSQDYDLWIRFSQKYNLYVYPEYLIKLRIHSKSVSAINKELQYIYSFFIGLGTLDNLVSKFIQYEKILEFKRHYVNELIKKNKKYSFKIKVRAMILIGEFTPLKYYNFFNPQFIIEIIKFYYYRPSLLLKNLLKL